MKELEEILKDYSTEHELFLSFLGVSFKILSNSRQLLDRLSAYYSCWEAKGIQEKQNNIIHAIVGRGIFNGEKLIDIIRRPGKVVKEAYYDTSDGLVILKKRTGVVVYIRNRQRYIVGNLIENMNQLINQVNEIYVQYFLDRGYILLHGSAVIDPRGHGKIFCSDSGTGKSTIAVALLEHGFRFLSNDRTLIKAEKGNTDLVGVPKKPRVNPGTILAVPRLRTMLSPAEIYVYASMDKGELWKLEQKHDVEVAEIFGMGRSALNGKPKSIYLLEWQRDGRGLAIETVFPEEAASLLQPFVLNLNPLRRQFCNDTRIEEQLQQLPGSIEVYRVRGGVDITGLCQKLEIDINRLPAD